MYDHIFFHADGSLKLIISNLLWNIFEYVCTWLSKVVISSQSTIPYHLRQKLKCWGTARIEQINDYKISLTRHKKRQKMSANIFWLCQNVHIFHGHVARSNNHQRCTDLIFLDSELVFSWYPHFCQNCKWTRFASFLMSVTL